MSSQLSFAVPTMTVRAHGQGRTCAMGRRKPEVLWDNFACHGTGSWSAQRGLCSQMEEGWTGILVSCQQESFGRGQGHKQQQRPCAPLLCLLYPWCCMSQPWPFPKSATQLFFPILWRRTSCTTTGGEVVSFQASPQVSPIPRCPMQGTHVHVLPPQVFYTQGCLVATILKGKGDYGGNRGCLNNKIMIT